MNKYKLLFWIWLSTILTVSSIPGISTPSISVERFHLELRLDYILHFLEYMILVFLFYKWKNEYKFFKIFISIGVFVIIAGIDEFHQLIIPGRVFNPNDLFFNILGLIAGTVFTTLFLRAKNNIPSADLQ